VVDLYFTQPLGVPDDAHVQVTHRWVAFRRARWTFGSTELEHEGRVTVVERSRGRFFGTLGLVAAAPVAIWGLAALALLTSFRIRRNPPPGGV